MALERIHNQCDTNAELNEKLVKAVHGAGTVQRGGRSIPHILAARREDSRGIAALVVGASGRGESGTGEGLEVAYCTTANAHTYRSPNSDLQEPVARRGTDRHWRVVQARVHGRMDEELREQSSDGRAEADDGHECHMGSSMQRRALGLVRSHWEEQRNSDVHIL